MNGKVTVAALFAATGFIGPSIPAYAAPPAGNPAAGKAVFAKCAACHSVASGDNRLGPSLAGVVGRKAGTVPGYNYSAALKGSGVTWTPAALDAYLANPRAKIPGIKMVFMGLPKPEDRANMIAYLAKPK
jgi:cytochrome c